MTDPTTTNADERLAGRGPRTGAEWVTFMIACAILVALAVVIVARTGDDTPAEPIATSEQVTHSAAGYEVTVKVRNAGGLTAAEVQVRAELTIDGEATESDQVVDFLAGDDAEHLTFVFEDDPADGELVVEVTGYSTP